MEKSKLTPFKQALTQAVLEEQEHLMEQEPEEVAFSPNFQARMAALGRRTERKSWRWVNTAAKRALLAAVLALLLAGTVVAAVPELRAGLIRFFTHNNGVAYEFRFEPEDIQNVPERIETAYAPTYITSGYDLVDELTSVSAVSRIYMDTDGWMIDYTQLPIWSVDYSSDENEDELTHVLGVDSEGAETRYEIINGYEVMIIRTDPEDPHDPTVYVWTDHEYLFSLLIVNSQQADMTEFAKIQSSIQTVPLDLENGE